MYLEKPESLIIGVMSGTSMDSIDAALCSVSESVEGRLSVDLLHFYQHTMDSRLRDRLLGLLKDQQYTLPTICSLNFEVGYAFADAINGLLDESRTASEQVTAIASHGQTVFHIPPHQMIHSDYPKGLVPSTLQIGESSAIADRTGIRVISDFRTADMAAGGNGAPLVPFSDFHLFQSEDNCVVQNIGGIGNCTFVPAKGSPEQIIAFDTGPGNVMIDLLTQHFYPDQGCDFNGLHGANGKVIPELLKRLMSMPFLHTEPPKSTGRELFGEPMVKEIIAQYTDAQPDDLIATVTHFTACSIACNLAEFIFSKYSVPIVYFSGGGVNNPFLFQLLNDELKNCSADGCILKTTDEMGIPSKARECIAFALLGHARLRGIPGNVPSATGAQRGVLLGKITDPS